MRTLKFLTAMHEWGKGPSIYYVSIRTGLVGPENLYLTFSNCISAEIEGGSKKAQKCDAVIYGWSLMHFDSDPKEYIETAEAIMICH